MTTSEQFGTHEPGSIWRTPSGHLWIVDEGGRVRDYPSMDMAYIAPDLSDATHMAVRKPRRRNPLAWLIVTVVNAWLDRRWGAR